MAVIVSSLYSKFNLSDSNFLETTSLDCLWEGNDDVVVLVDLFGCFYLDLLRIFSNGNSAAKAAKLEHFVKGVSELFGSLDKTRVYLFTDGKPSLAKHETHISRLKTLTSSVDSLKQQLLKLEKGTGVHEALRKIKKARKPTN